mmetsp:Transcript_30029/g.89250  ORF Transcript_30029/g.89250 Transcript_30029/m.89250 type:complete len:142 (-) Transcript_30029:230-655(-)
MGQIMDTVLPFLPDQSVLNHRHSCQDMAQGVSTSFLNDNKTAWRQWWKYSAWLGVRSDLKRVQVHIPILQIYAHRVRAGLLATKGCHIRKRSIEQHLRSIGQIFSAVGAHDTRLDSLGRIDYHLRQQLAKLQREDPAPTRM